MCVVCLYVLNAGNQWCRLARSRLQILLITTTIIIIIITTATRVGHPSRTIHVP